MKYNSIFIILLSIISGSCYFTDSHSRGVADIYTIGLLDSLPFYNQVSLGTSENPVTYPARSIKLISFYKNYRIYQIPVIITWDTLDFTNNYIEKDHEVRSDTNYYYYLRVDTSTIIYRFNSLTEPDFIQLPVDSLYKHTTKYREPSLLENKVLQYAQKVGRQVYNDLVVDIYVGLAGKPSNAIDTCYMMYSRNEFWDKIPYTFSYTADSISHMKLVKYKLVLKGNPAHSEPHKRIDSFLSVEMKEIHPANEADLLKAFQAFEKFLSK